MQTPRPSNKPDEWRAPDGAVRSDACPPTGCYSTRNQIICSHWCSHEHTHPRHRASLTNPMTGSETTNKRMPKLFRAQKALLTAIVRPFTLPVEQLHLFEAAESRIMYCKDYFGEIMSCPRWNPSPASDRRKRKSLAGSLMPRKKPNTSGHKHRYKPQAECDGQVLKQDIMAQSRTEVQAILTEAEQQGDELTARGQARIAEAVARGMCCVLGEPEVQT